MGDDVINNDKTKPVMASKWAFECRPAFNKLNKRFQKETLFREHRLASVLLNSPKSAFITMDSLSR